MMTEFRISR